MADRNIDAVRRIVAYLTLRCTMLENIEDDIDRAIANAEHVLRLDGGPEQLMRDMLSTTEFMEALLTPTNTLRIARMSFQCDDAAVASMRATLERQRT
jgi:hypothetical protein